MQENLQNQGASPIQSQNLIWEKRNLAIIFALVIVGIILLGGVFYTGVKFAENRQNLSFQNKTGLQNIPSYYPSQKITPVSSSNKELSEWYSVGYPSNFFNKTGLQNIPSYYPSQKITPVSSSNKELSEWYSVEYPSNFFVVRRDYRTFGVAESRWKGEFGHIPEAAIEMYTNVLPDGMSLKDWVNGVGDPTPPSGQGTPKSCKEFLNAVRQKVKFGDLFNIEYLKGDYCIYFGVSDIKETTISGLPAIEFSTKNVSSIARHTIVAYKNQSGVILLFDIYYTMTGMSDEKDQTVNAYKSFLNTFKTKER